MVVVVDSRTYYKTAEGFRVMGVSRNPQILGFRKELFLARNKVVFVTSISRQVWAMITPWFGNTSGCRSLPMI
jgi:hypothetical protein